MKKIILFLFLVGTATTWAQDAINDEAPRFIVHMADARIMDREEGRLAAQLGTTQAIRDYGNLMVKDQEMLLEKIKQLAASKNITLPNAISEKKSKQLQKLSRLQGKPFDRKFLKMIKNDHKRDVKRFTKASGFEDAATKQFAQQNLALIEQHLEKAKAL